MVRLKKERGLQTKYLYIDAIRKAADFLKNSEVYYCDKNIHIDFDNFDHIIDETTCKLIKDCK